MTFTNSDPGMVILFLTYLRAVGVRAERLRLRFAIHESADVPAAARYWSDLLAVPVDCLQPPTLKRHVATTERKNVGEEHHGCLVVGVLQSSTLYRRIEGTWWAVRQSGNRLTSPDTV